MRTEAELVEAAQRGDRSAMERLLERHRQTVYRFGRRMCQGDEDAEDILQDTLLAAVRSLPGFRGESSVSTWLYAIARSFCIKQRRHARLAPDAWGDLDGCSSQGPAWDPPDRSRAPDELLERRLLERALDDAIRNLGPSHREVLVLRVIDGLSTSETAELLGLSAEAVKGRLHRAREAIRGHASTLLSLAAGPAARGRERRAANEACRPRRRAKDAR